VYNVNDRRALNYIFPETLVPPLEFPCPRPQLSSRSNAVVSQSRRRFFILLPSCSESVSIFRARCGHCPALDSLFLSPILSSFRCLRSHRRHIYSFFHTAHSTIRPTSLCRTFTSANLRCPILFGTFHHVTYILRIFKNNLLHVLKRKLLLRDHAIKWGKKKEKEKKSKSRLRAWWAGRGARVVVRSMAKKGGEGAERSI
jgi:hypothetical protein